MTDGITVTFASYRRPVWALSREWGGYRFFAALALSSGLATPALAEGPAGAAYHALDSMPPGGHWAARLELRSNSYDAWYGDNGRRRPLGAEYDGVVLDAAVIPALAVYGPGVNLGTTRFASRVETEFASLTAGYGLSDDLTVGFILPYARTRNQVRFSVDGGNVGDGTATVQGLLTDAAYGYAYEPVRTTVTEGIGDPTVGGLWRFYKGKADSAVLALGVHLGLAEKDDPDNLLDVPSGDGSTDLEARVEYFRALGGDWDLHLLARHREQLPDHAVMRVQDPGELLPQAASKERLKRDLGDYREFDIELGHTWGDWRGSVTWHLYDQDRTRYTSARGTDTRALSVDTRYRADQWRAGASWSGVRAWQAGKLPLPLVVRLEMQRAYGGRNFPDLTDLYLQVTSFF